MVEVLAIATPGVQWDESVKARAYEVYSKQCNGDMVCTLRVLDAWDGPKIPEKTVYDWRSRYRWRQELDAEKQAIAPISWALWFGGLSVAALEALNDLRSIIQNPEASDRDRIAADRVVLQLAQANIDRIEERHAAANRPASLPEELSDADILALEERLARGETGPG